MNKRIVSFSGGKDSTTMLLLLIDRGVKIDHIVFADTTLELPGMFDYIFEVQEHIKRKIIITKPARSFDELFYGKIVRGRRKGQIRGLPAVLYPCYWNAESIRDPMQPFTYSNYVYLGITADESRRATKRRYFTPVYPLVDLGITANSCFTFLRDRNLLNPLYLHSKRTGCWLCPRQTIAQLRNLFLHYPDLWTQLKIYASLSYEFSPCLNIPDLDKRFTLESST